jgi:hypothetical protein
MKKTLLTLATIVALSGCNKVEQAQEPIYISNPQIRVSQVSRLHGVVYDGENSNDFTKKAYSFDWHEFRIKATLQPNYPANRREAPYMEIINGQATLYIYTQHTLKVVKEL